MNTNEYHLWEMETSWFEKSKNETMNSTFPYKSWKDFRECKPYKLWKPYILSSWSWKKFKLDDQGFIKTTKRHEPERYAMECTKILRVNPSQYDKDIETLKISEPNKEIDMLQIVFISPERFVGIHRVEVVVEKENEQEIKEWIQRHMPRFWKL